jgi:hypothetical protein
MRNRSLLELTRRRKNRILPKKTRFIPKPELHVRQKIRPAGQTAFCVEVRLLPITNIPVAMLYGRIGLKAHERYGEWETLEAIMREMIGGRFKIIRNSKRGMIGIKILLEREEDLILLVLAQPGLIAKTYRYV